MVKTFTRIFIATLALVSASFAVNVTVSSPSNGATVSSPTTIQASASSGSIITGWRIYLDGKSVYQAGTTSSISAPISMSAGTHQLIVRAWDSTGTYGSYNLQVTAGHAAPSTGTPGNTAGVTVNVSAPSNGATVASPATISASAAGGSITGWRIYVDGNSVYSAGAQPSISASLPMATGTRQVIVRAWNSTGAYGSANMAVNVGGSPSTPSTDTPSDGGPTAPAHAKVFTKIEEMSGWGHCATYECSGSSKPASYWMTPYQTTPSLDGASTLFYVNGAAWADVLWYKSLGSSAANATHFLLDYWLKPNADTLTRAEALEFDIVNSYNGRKWDFSNQMHYNTQHWDTWDGVALKWVHTNMPAPKLDPNKWHHIKILVERVGTQTHYISYTVDGVTTPIPNQYAWQNTIGTSWANAVVVQVQMDVNANPGVISEYIDKMTLYAW